VNIIPYRHQPHCFWKEILKELMHSMSMSMIRDKAVGNFVERLHRITLQQLHQNEKSKSISSPSFTSTALLPAGWLELRKGYHTYVNEKNDLIILKDGLLRRNLVIYNPATTKNQMITKLTSKKKDGKQEEDVKQVINKPNQENQQSSISDVSISATESTASTISLNCASSMFSITNHILVSDMISPSLSTMTLSAEKDEEKGMSFEMNFDMVKFLQLSKEDYSSSIFIDEDLGSLPVSLGIAGAVPSEHIPCIKTLPSFGPWKIEMTLKKVVSATVYDSQFAHHINNKQKLLKNVHEILEGTFSYQIYWPFVRSPDSVSSSSIEVSFIFLKDYLQMCDDFILQHRLKQATANDNNSNNTSNHVEYYSLSHHFLNEETTLFPDIIHSLSFELKSMELRLRDGLPILVPSFLKEVPDDVSEGKKRILLNYPAYFTESTPNKYYAEFELSYSYQE
jgi:hypothetical protein